MATTTASRAPAANFTVDPTRILLSARSGSALLTLRNESTAPLRFQLSVFAWSQSISGEMQLEPTQDIVFFPSLLILRPGEERRVRVGRATLPADREKTYRIFVEELPPLGEPEQHAGGVRVLTKMGIPVFVRPTKEVASASLDRLRQEAGRAWFTLTNTGTVHFVPQTITVRGFKGSTPGFERSLEGWYVLAGGRREFALSLPETECALITSLVVDIKFGSGRLQERLATPAGACSR